MNHLVVGYGQVGKVLYKLMEIKIGSEFLMRVDPAEGFDIDPDPKTPVNVMHICFPYFDEFSKEVLAYLRKFKAQNVIIHSTVAPETTQGLRQYAERIYYSPVRGQHNNLLKDMMRYKKFIAPLPSSELLNELSELFRLVVKNNTTELEVAKLLDTTQYGILIAWAQEAERIAERFKVSHEFVREFGKETNQFYGLRPDIRSDFCGGHCVRQNIALLRQFYRSPFFDMFIGSNQKKGQNLHIEDEVNYG